MLIYEPSVPGSPSVKFVYLSGEGCHTHAGVVG
jgi:hypothetical protein